MAKPAARIIFLEAVLVLAGGAVVARSFWLQVVQHNTWIAKAGKSRAADLVVPARRGRILDRNGEPLAVSQEQYRISISLSQVKDTAALRAMVARLPKVTRPRLDEEFAKDHPYFHGPYGAEEVDALRGMHGVYLEVLYNRVYPVPGLADRIIGQLDENGTAVEGLEKALDTLLQGRPGLEHYLVDGRGNRFPAPGPRLVEPTAGRDVELTIDADLQGIAEAALGRAVHDHQAHGGEMVIMDIHTGELYAVASLRTDTSAHPPQIVSSASALLDQNEPGSTSKIFTAAALLRTGADTTPVDGEGGDWNLIDNGRLLHHIHDEHPIHGPATLGETVKVSSNIAISKFALRLHPEEQYEAIRDFGFGTYAGVGFPGEALGKLRRPVRWENEKLSKTEIATGYEWEASGVQLAAGYGAIANRGVLMTPTLVRHVHDAHGATTWTHQADTVRRAVPDSIAQHLLEYLRLTEDSGGTGIKAQLDRYKVAGKTGTARRGKANSGEYRASFVGLFPDDAPQIVIYIMVDRPTTGGKFGAEIAAPMIRQTMQQALAARTSPLDRSRLTAPVAAPIAASAAAADLPVARRVAVPVVAAAAARDRVAVPDLAGLPARQAVTTLEKAGFQIRLVGRARVRATSPLAGDSLLRGATVTIFADSLR